MTASLPSLTTPLQVPQAPPLRPARDSFWTRIAAELAEAIGSGVYPPGQRLPSEHALAEQFGVNRHTIRRSLASLCSQGLVRITQGSGTYVEDFAVDLVLGKRTRHQQGLAQAGLRGCLVALSDSAADHLKDGFLTDARTEERTCPGMFAEILFAVTSVTETRISANIPGQVRSSSRSPTSPRRLT
eukprot:gene14591-19309_t